LLAILESDSVSLRDGEKLESFDKVGDGEKEKEND
jgi:hypothetical protein